MNRFHLATKGETANVTDNRDESEMALNRRVEIDIGNTNKHSAFEQFKQEAQVFKIAGYEETTIVTKGGVTLVFGPDIFENFKEYLSIQINIQEFLRKKILF